MRRGDEAGASNNNEYWEVSHLAARLNQYACEVGGRHLADDFIRMQFTQEVAGVGQSIVEELGAGKISVVQALTSLDEEYAELFTQVGEYAKLVAGVIAGVMQVRTGVAVCVVSPGPGCLLAGGPLVLHGLNNIYENGLNIINRRSDTVGPVRSAYQRTARFVGGTDSHGNIIYGVADLGLSGYSLIRTVPRPGTWRLFRYLEADQIMAYKTMGAKAIMFEIGIDMLTGEQVLVEVKKE